MKLYKALGENRMGRYSGFQWPEIGEWTEPVESLIVCKSGYHLCRRGDLVGWLHSEIYEAEYRGELIETPDNVVVSQARLVRKLDTWNDKTARLFACDCAERVVHLADDERSRNAIVVARRYAAGEATADELRATRDAAWDAARGAAWDAARGAAWDAAWDAARGAAWDATRDAAWNAAWYAARSAASSAAWAAARAAEREWQTERLFDYLEGKR